MATYPNRDALRNAHDIYLNAMHPFITQNALDIIEGGIDIADIAHIITKDWFDSFKQCFEDMDPYYEARSAAWQVVESRNRASHPPWDLDPEFTRTHLFLIANLLEKINRPDAKREVEDIRDRLFSHEEEEHTADVFDQLEVVRAENTELKKHLNTTSSRLEEVETEWIASEERLTDMSNLLKSVEAENADLKKRLLEKENRLKTVESESGERIKTSSEQLRTVEAERTGLGEHLKNLLNQPKILKTKQPKTSKTLEDRVEIGRKVAELRINAAGSKPLAWKKIREKLGLNNDEFHKVIRLEDHFKESVVERIESFEDGWEYGGKLKVLLGFEPVGELANRIEACKPAPNAPSPNSITFQGTTFTRHLSKYHVTEDDISQNFWHYWHSQGREGKQKMRDAGWSVEKVNGDWEVTISTENFQAWIEDEVSELSSLINPSQSAEPLTQSIRPAHERTSLPTVSEMVKPALKVLADGKEHRRVEIIDYLTEHFSLTDDKRNYLSKTGQAEKHLMNKGLIERTRTGYYRITTLGFILSRTSC